MLIITLNPSLERNRVEIIEAIEPKRIAPAIELKTISGIVIKMNYTDSKNTGYPTAIIKAALTKPTIAIVIILLRM